MVPSEFNNDEKMNKLIITLAFNEMSKSFPKLFNSPENITKALISMIKTEKFKEIMTSVFSDLLEKDDDQTYF